MSRRRARVAPIAVDDREADPVEGIAVEYRRTIAWIRFCEKQINDLREDRDLVFGLAAQHSDSETTAETRTGSEGGEDVAVEVSRTVTKQEEKYEARINTWIELLNFNRKFLDQLVSKWLQYGLDVRRVRMEEALVDSLVEVIGYVVRELGRDPADPEVRTIVRRAFDAAGQPTH